MVTEALDPLDLCDVRSLLSDDERMVRDAVARFIDERVLPIVGICFDEGRFPVELIPEIASLGLLGATIPTEYGGAGLNQVSYGLICEELERGDSGFRSFASVQSSLVMYPIFLFGSEEQKRHYLPGMARGEIIGCFGLTESHGGSDPANMLTHARRDGSDWVISGSKMWITNGTLAQVALVWARTDEGVRGFLIPTDTKGFTAQPIHRKMSLRVSATAALYLDDVRVPAEAMLPGAKGLRGPLTCLDSARLGISWGPLGAARACLREALDYVADRKLFGRPLAANQAMQVRLAEMARRLATAQLLALRVARLKDAGRLQATQVSLAKWNNVRMAIDIARECRDILGAAGITTEYVAIRHALNLESVITYEGTQTVHQLVIGRALTGVNAF
ncbi:MAG: acyl-CoA dehydrogenase [Nevskiaceae bacterium]|nr:MAG: acyl-CoA dehydrogenase [Nevskiaceae bacterium]TBR71327.1 MAG: acyl-CoA dehydrogenase [Nevskiaceae bacterium]